MQAPEDSSRARTLRIWSVAIGLVLLTAGVVTLGTRYETYTASTAVMAPHFRQGELAIVQPGHADLSRGDVVVVDGTHWPGVPVGFKLVLRIAAVGGDRITCCDQAGRMLLNGQPLSEPYALGANDGFGRFDVTVPEGRIFLLGDERDRSRDSRELLSPGHVHADHTHDHAGTEATHATLAITDLRGRVLTVVSPPWRLRPVSVTGPASLHHYALGAVGLGVVLIIAGALPAAVGGSRRLVRAVRKRREPTW